MGNSHERDSLIRAEAHPLFREANPLPRDPKLALVFWQIIDGQGLCELSYPVGYLEDANSPELSDSDLQRQIQNDKKVVDLLNSFRKSFPEFSDYERRHDLDVSTGPSILVVSLGNFVDRLTNELDEESVLQKKLDAAYHYTELGSAEDCKWITMLLDELAPEPGTAISGLDNDAIDQYHIEKFGRSIPRIQSYDILAVNLLAKDGERLADAIKQQAPLIARPEDLAEVVISLGAQQALERWESNAAVKFTREAMKFVDAENEKIKSRLRDDIVEILADSGLLGKSKGVGGLVDWLIKDETNTFYESLVDEWGAPEDVKQQIDLEQIFLIPSAVRHGAAVEADSPNEPDHESINELSDLQEWNAMKSKLAYNQASFEYVKDDFLLRFSSKFPDFDISEFDDSTPEAGDVQKYNSAYLGTIVQSFMYIETWAKNGLDEETADMHRVAHKLAIASSASHFLGHEQSIWIRRMCDEAFLAGAAASSFNEFDLDAASYDAIGYTGSQNLAVDYMERSVLAEWYNVIDESEQDCLPDIKDKDGLISRASFIGLMCAQRICNEEQISFRSEAANKYRLEANEASIYNSINAIAVIAVSEGLELEAVLESLNPIIHKITNISYRAMQLVLNDSGAGLGEHELDELVVDLFPAIFDVE